MSQCVRGKFITDTYVAAHFESTTCGAIEPVDATGRPPNGVAVHALIYEITNRIRLFACMS